MINIDIDTTQETRYEQNWYSPKTEWERPRIKMCKLPDYYSFDLEKLRQEVELLKEDFPFKPFVLTPDGRKRLTYEGLCLTSRPNIENPEYDGMRLFAYEDAPSNTNEIHIRDTFKTYFGEGTEGPDKLPVLNEKLFNTPTKAYRGYIAEVINKFHTTTTKCRLLNLRPRGVVPAHVDFPYYQQIRVHAAIYSNDDVWFQIEGEKFQIPADGNFYWFDTGRNHAVTNQGSEDRLTLSVNLSVYEHYTSQDDLIDLINQAKI